MAKQLIWQKQAASRVTPQDAKTHPVVHAAIWAEVFVAVAKMLLLAQPDAPPRPSGAVPRPSRAATKAKTKIAVNREAAWAPGVWASKEQDSQTP